MGINGDEPSGRRSELRNAVHVLRERCQYESAAWAAELMSGLPVEEDSSLSPMQRSIAAEIGPSSSSLSQAEEDQYMVARSMFDMREYRRAAHHLQNAENDKAVFLRCYALYVAGERRREEERIELSGTLGSAECLNEDLDEVEATLRRWLLRSNDALCAFLLGLVLCDRERLKEARMYLLQSLSRFPCHWGAWKALLLASGGADAPLPDPDLPKHWMRDVYFSSLCIESRENEEGLGRLQALLHDFPSSDWVLMQAAIAQYHLRNFDNAEAIFQDILSRDPHCIKGMDEYSNILYVKELPALLSHLAHRVASDDKYRPESCCIMGNYYSLNINHEKAVVYFQRAIKQDRRYLNAWTLMGHEYVEMKNPTAAIDAYRRATGLNQNDYRAWYGLGQTYELLQMPFYALHYYKRALQLRPNDARMWVAMGQCLENDQLRLTEKAITCYHKAIKFGDREGIALHKLGLLYESLDDPEAAAHYFQQNLDRIDAMKASGSDQQVALLALANFKKGKGEWAAAEGYCLRLLDMGGVYKDKAKALLRDIRSMQASIEG